MTDSLEAAKQDSFNARPPMAPIYPKTLEDDPLSAKSLKSAALNATVARLDTAFHSMVHVATPFVAHSLPFPFPCAASSVKNLMGSYVCWGPGTLHHIL